MLFKEELLQLSSNLNANWDHGDHSEVNASEYEDSLDPDGPVSSNEEQIDEGRKKKMDKGIQYNPNTKLGDTFFFVGQEFADTKEFKKALSSYSRDGHGPGSGWVELYPVSYTHLTLPTKRIV